MTESSSPGPSPVPHDLAATSAERRAFGKGTRQRMPRGTLEWDVKGSAASLVGAARESRVKPARAAAAVTAGVEAYARRMRRYATMPELDIWYDSTHVDDLIGYFEPADRGRVSIHIEKK